jgi:hypothetical protein
VPPFWMGEPMRLPDWPGAPMDHSGPALHGRACWRCRPAAVCAGLRSAVTGRLVRLRIGQLMDGRRSRACRSAGQAHHPFGVR